MTIGISGISIDRREFLKTTAALAAAGALSSPAAFASATGRAPAWQATQEGPMAYNPATWYRPYVSQLAQQPDTEMWLQIDLGAAKPIDGLRLYPAFTPGDLHARSYGFPLRFRIEASSDPSFGELAIALVDQSAADFRRSGGCNHCVSRNGAGERALRPPHRNAAASGAGWRRLPACPGQDRSALRRAADAAERCPVTGDPAYANPTDFAQLTRAPRPMGEGIVTDNPANVIPAAQWRQVPFAVTIPVSGVTPQGEHLPPRHGEQHQLSAQLVLRRRDAAPLSRARRQAGRCRPAQAHSVLGHDAARLQRRPIPDGRRQHAALD